MKKKTYIAPETDLVTELLSTACILAGSTPGSGDVNGDPVGDGGAAKHNFSPEDAMWETGEWDE